MKRFTPVKNKQGMLAIKENYPCIKLCQTIDLIEDMVKGYGNYKIIDFGLSYHNYNDNHLVFNTNIPWEVFEA